jgi:hypothetical protein
MSEMRWLFLLLLFQWGLSAASLVSYEEIQFGASAGPRRSVKTRRHNHMHRENELNSSQSTLKELRFPKKRCRYSDHEFEDLTRGDRERVSRVNGQVLPSNEESGGNGYYVSSKAAKKADPNQVKQPRTRDEFNNRHYNSSKKRIFDYFYLFLNSEILVKREF